MTTNNVVREAQSAGSYDPLAKHKAAAKLSRIPVKVEQAEVLKKPDWIRVRAGSPTTRFYEIKQILREHKLHTVCEEASRSKTVEQQRAAVVLLQPTSRATTTDKK